MAEVQMIRTVKLRSKENQAYSPRYNRANFEVPTDMYSTDLSQSYLDLTLRVMSKADNQAISTEDLVALKAKDVGISWGQGEFDYSPACLIKEAVLKRGSDASILESIPFCNIISQTLHQLTVNKEMEQSMSLVSGSVVNQGQKSSVFSARSSILTNPINVHIPLSDMFQLCKSQNFWMSQTKGLMIELLFEDKLDLLTVNNVLAKTDIIFDATGATSYGSSYENYVSQGAKSARIEAFPTVVAGNIETTTVADKGRLYRSAQYFDEVGYDVTPVIAGTTTPNQAIIFKDKTLVVSDINDMGIKENDNVRMVFSLGGNNPKMFEMINSVSNIIPFTPEVPGAGPTPGQSTYSIPVTSIAEWSGANSADYLKGTATAGDITGNIGVDIDPTSGNYTLNPLCTFETSKDYVVGDAYIMPGSYLNVPTASATTDFTITFTSAVASGTAPTAGDIAVTGSYGQAIPDTPGAPGTPAIFPQLVMSDAWYSDSTVKPKLVSIEVMTAQVFEFLNDGTTLTGEITQEILQGTFNDATKNGPHLLQLTEAMVTDLLTTGLIKEDATTASGYRVSPEAVFDAAIQLAYPQVSAALSMAQMIANKQITQIAPEVIDRGVYSNGAVSLPNSGRGVRLTGIRKVVNDFYLQFTPLDLTPGVDEGFQFFGVDRASNSSPWVPSAQPPVGFKFIFSRYNAPGTVDAGILGRLAKGLTYSVDKFELVLVQSSKNKKMPMAQAYPSYRVEPFTIQNPLQSFERQFNVTEPNVFNVAIMSPHAGSLVSTGREINRYRWQINNISNTSTDIVLKTATSDYPSGMHLDKMLDYFSNGSAPLKNFFGLKGLECVSRPVAIFPLKIYTSSDQSMMFNNSTAFTAQVLFESNKTIEQGTMLFVKSVIKMI